MPSEQQVQKQIINYLEDKGYVAIKIIVANKSGVPDIVGCTKKGKFFAIEVKKPGKKPTKLQQYKLDKIAANKGIAFSADSVDVVKKLL